MFKACCGTLKPRIINYTLLISRNSYGNKPKERRVAIVLSGCGSLDGTEIHEASATAVNVTKYNLQALFYAPSCPQGDVMDHLKCCPVNEQRSALVESARIARGTICPLPELSQCDAEAVIFPGGLGVAKTLTTYENDGVGFDIDADVLRVMQEFHEAKKPMAFMCLSALLPARVFPCVRITLGKRGDPKKWPHSKAIDDACILGAEVEMRAVDSFTFDKQNLIFSTPAFMYAGTYIQIFEGISNMIHEMVKIM